LRPLLLGLHPWPLSAAGRTRPGDVGAWEEEDVAAWLEELGLGTHASAFRREQVDGPALLELTPEELRHELGVAPLGVRKRLLREVNLLREGNATAVALGTSCRSLGSAEELPQSSPSTAAAVPQHGWGFDFGGNWLRFLSDMLEEDSPMGIAEAKASFFDIPVRRIHGRIVRFMAVLLDDYGLTSAEGLTFLDIGSGHGLASLAALGLNASHVISLDVDTRPVQMLRDMVRAHPELRLGHQPWQNWTIVSGSILDTDFISSGILPKADLVWSYGVLHHTGNLSLALQNVARLVLPGSLVKIDLHTSEEMAFMADWLEFKKEWTARPHWYKEEALIAYMFSELWVEMEEHVRRNTLESYFPGMSKLPGFFPRFESVRHVVHSRFWHYSKGRGMDFVIDAVDWLGGYPYEMWRTYDVLAALSRTEPPLQALHATFAGFAGLLLTPAVPGLGWVEAWEGVRGKIGNRLVDKPGAIWYKRRKMSTLSALSMDNFSTVVEKNCGPGRPDLPQSVICDDEFLAAVKGQACWVTFFSAEESKNADMSLFHLLEDGVMYGWGAPEMSLCIPGSGANYRFFPAGVLLFTVRDGSDPRTNGRRYDLLLPN